MVKFTRKSRSKVAKASAIVVSLALATSLGMSSVVASAYTTSGIKGDYYSMYGSKDDVVKAGNALNEEISEEGFVLLKNNGVLPLAAQTVSQSWWGTSYKSTTVSVFGKASTNLLIGGSGSGSGNTAGAATIYDSLTSAGYSVNKTLWDWYSGTDSGANSYPSGGSDQVIHGLATIETTTDAFNAGKSVFEESLSTYNGAAVVVFARQGGEGFDLPTSSVGSITLPENAEVGDTLKLSENSTPLKGREGEDRYLDHYLQLDEDEEALLQYVESKFDKVIVVINSSNTMELGELENDEKVDGIVWVGGPGNQGINALGRLLSGEVNFSGHTTDMYVKDFSTIPAVSNFGEYHAIGSDTIAYCVSDGKGGTQWVYGNAYLNQDGSVYYLNDSADNEGYGLSKKSTGLASHGNVYCKVEYEEDIFVGYRYYETMAADKGSAGEAWYNSNVVYPFGYGLSYTTFSQEVVSAKVKGGNNISSSTTLTGNETLEISVKVKNTGKVAGKDVVQLYVAAPYSATTAPISKAVRTLVDFGKTDTLEAGEEQTMSFEIKLQDLASYDYSDVNSDSHKGYELDKGTYTITAMKNSHESYGANASTSFQIGNVVDYNTDSITGNTVENRFVDYGWGTTAGNYNTVSSTMKIMNRATGLEASAPAAPTRDEMKETKSFFTALGAENTTVNYNFADDTEDVAWYYSEVPTGVSQVAETATDSDRTISIKWADMKGVAKDDAKWDEFLNQFKFSELKGVIGAGAKGAATVVDKAASSNSDGPSTISTVSYASECVIASTFNKDLAERMGTLIGEEALWSGKSGWYAPAMNTHRTPFSGRNFEYYSEDPILAGFMAANTVKGAESMGLRCFIKHYALNDCETDKSAPSLVTYASEQAIREIYLKPFQMAIELGGATGIMTSFNRVGTVSSANNWALINGIARGEWGFTGYCTTDMFVKTYMNVDKMIRSGNEVPFTSGTVAGSYNASENMVYVPVLDTTTGVYAKTDTIKSPTQYMLVRQSAKNILYAALNSNEILSVTDGVTYDKVAKDLSLIQGGNLGIAKAGEKYYGSVGVSNALCEALDAEVTLYEVVGDLPAGLSLDGQTGVISGTVATAGDYSFTVRYYVNGWIAKDVVYDITVVATGETPVTSTDISGLQSQIDGVKQDVNALQQDKATSSTDKTEETTKKSGCGSVMNTTAYVMIACLATCGVALAAVGIKRKSDRRSK